MLRSLWHKLRCALGAHEYQLDSLANWPGARYKSRCPRCGRLGGASKC